MENFGIGKLFIGRWLPFVGLRGPAIAEGKDLT